MCDAVAALGSKYGINKRHGHGLLRYVPMFATRWNDAGRGRASPGLVVWSYCLFSVAICLSVGCQDSPSARRIQLRSARNLQLARDLSGLERRHSQRLIEARAELRAWWERDVTRFNHRREIVGDYFW